MLVKMMLTCIYTQEYLFFFAIIMHNYIRKTNDTSLNIRCPETFRPKI